MPVSLIALWDVFINEKQEAGDMGWKDEVVTPTCTIEKSDKGFDYWLSRDYVSESLQGDLQKANVIFVPLEAFRDVPSELFPAQTTDLLHFVQDHFSADIIADIAISDDDYTEIALHADEITLPTLIVQYGVLPIITGIVANFITTKLMSRKEKTNLKIQIYVERKSGDVLKLDFSGPAKDFQEIVSGSLESCQKLLDGEGKHGEE